MTADPTESVDLAPSRPGDVARLRARLDALNATRAPAAYCAATSAINALAVATHSETQFITPWLDAGYECDTAGSGSMPATWAEATQLDYCKYHLLPHSSCAAAQQQQ